MGHNNSNNNVESETEVEQIKVPCLLELFSDSSLNFFIKIDEENSISKVDNAEQIMEVKFENGKTSVKCLKKEVAVNGVILNVDDKISVSN